MSAPVAFTKGQLLAAAILNGKLPEGEHPQFTAAEWRDEADASIEANDYTELLCMVEHQREFDEWAERCTQYEMRTGREWDTGPLWDQQPRVTSGMA